MAFPRRPLLAMLPGIALSLTPAAAEVSIVVPASVVSSTSNHVASVKSNADATYEWSIRNGRLDSGIGRHSVTFTAGAPGPLVLDVTEKDASGKAVGAATATVDVVAQPGWYSESSRTVPIVLSLVGGRGDFFSSELTLTNRGSTAAQLSLTYSAAFGGGSGTATDTLEPGRQKVVPDAIEYLRSRNVPIPAAGNRGGSLTVRFSGLSSPDAGAVTVRTAANVPEGRAGLAYPGVSSAAALSGPSTICGLRQSATDRSNVALVNAGAPGDGSIVLRLTVRSGSSETVKQLADVELAPGEFRQINEVLRAEGLELTNGTVRVERISGSAPYIAYGVVNDNANGDGSYITPVPEHAFVQLTRLTLPAVVETAAFSTELVVANVSEDPRTVTLSLVADAVQNESKTATLTLALAPHEQQILPGFVDLLRQRGIPGIGPAGPTVVGALFAEVASGDLDGLFLGARVSSAGGGGRYGVFYSALPDGAGAHESTWVNALRQDESNRTNLAIVNLGDQGGDADAYRIEIYDGATGAKAATVEAVTVAARRFLQLTTLLAVYAPGVTNAYARVTRTHGFNAFLAYAVVNDGGTPGQRTGDGAFVAPASLSGRVLAQITMRLPTAVRAELELIRDELTLRGIALTPRGAVLPLVPAAGFRVHAGSKRTFVNRDGFFTFDSVPTGVTLAEVRSESGLDRQTFPLGKALVGEGQIAEPILIPILWDGPLGMNEGDPTTLDLPPDPGPLAILGGAAGQSAPEERDFPTFLCPSNEDCQDRTASCAAQPATCCLDFNGYCVDGHRYAGICYLRYLQWFTSTCFNYTVLGCCHEESAYNILPGGGGDTLTCYETHKFRICQKLDILPSGLQLSATPLDPANPRYLAFEYVTVTCGETKTLYLHNNTCANSTEVQFVNGAGGNVMPVGDVPHYDDTQHLTDLTLTYTAPKLGTGEDRVIAIAHLWFRIVVITVICPPPPPQRCALPANYPLHNGDKYAYGYTSPTTSFSFENTVVGPVTAGAITGPVYRLEQRRDGKLTGAVYVVSDTNGFVEHGLDALNDAGQLVQAIRWRPPYLTTCLDDGQSQTQERLEEHVLKPNEPTQISLLDRKVTGLGFETVTVPAGTFVDCYKTMEEFSAPGQATRTRTRWFAKDVGIVKTQSSAGETVVLTSYRPAP